MNAEEENNVLKQKIEGLEKHVAELEEHLKIYKKEYPMELFEKL